MAIDPVFSIIVEERIAHLEKEHTRALARSRDYSAKAAEEEQKAINFLIQMEGLREWLAPEKQPVANGGSGSDASISDAVRSYLLSHLDIHTDKIIAAVQSRIPSATANAITTELARSEKRGQSERIKRGVYQSLIYQSSAPVAPSSIPTLPQEEEEDLTDPFAE